MDYYDTLTASEQASFRATLFAVVSQGACPTVDLSEVKSPDSLTDPSTRALAVDCAQTALGVGTSAGVLDVASYRAIMHPATAMPFWEKAVVLAAVVLGLSYAFRRKRRRR